MAQHLVMTQKPAGGQALIQAELDNSKVNAVIPNVPCEATVFIGAAVVMKIDGVAKNGLADGIANSNIIGIVDSKKDSTTCTIRVANVTLDVFAGLDVTREYYLSSTVPGEITTSVPTASGTVRLKLGQPFSATSLLIMKGERMLRS